MTRTIPPRWLQGLALALVLGLAAPAIAEETDTEPEEKPATAEQTEADEAVEPDPAAALRVEQGRVMTNRDTGAPAPPTRKVKLQEGMVITNDLLERIVGPPLEAPTEDATTTDGPAAERPTATPADPMQTLVDEQAAAAAHQRRIAEAEGELEAAKTKLANLEVQLLAARNPFSKRPNLSDEEKERRRTSGETAAQLYERTKEETETARAEVKAAEDNLAQLRGGS